MHVPKRRLLVLPSYFAVDHRARADTPVGDSWLAAVRGPDGLTVVRGVSPDAAGETDCWVGLYGDDPHSLDLPGMLAAVVGPLGSAGVPVFVASTYTSDLVLVPRERYADAEAALRAAGHEVVASGNHFIGGRASAAGQRGLAGQGQRPAERFDGEHQHIRGLG
ncbi:ACT domain-containing protein [Streptomyces sp. NPDC093675]|uniref:ACT domain-containing protein n=1 Tax=Streptomyces sp. NPDC093675 TaxID=3366049 RepID=UPI0038137B33